MELKQCAPSFLLSIFAAAGPAFFNDRNPDAGGQFSHRRGKIDMLILHHKTEDTAAHAAAKTMKGLALRTNGERRGLFLVEWAERLEIRAGTLQREIGRDHLHDVVGGGDLLDRL